MFCCLQGRQFVMDDDDNYAINEPDAKGPAKTAKPAKAKPAKKASTSKARKPAAKAGSKK